MNWVICFVLFLPHLNTYKGGKVSRIELFYGFPPTLFGRKSKQQFNSDFELFY